MVQVAKNVLTTFVLNYKKKLFLIFKLATFFLCAVIIELDKRAKIC